MPNTWEYELFISIQFQQYEIYKERLGRFKGESTESSMRVYDFRKGRSLHYIIKQDSYCQSRQCITPEEIVILLLFYYYRSSRYIIWRSSCRYYQRRRYKYLCITC